MQLTAEAGKAGAAGLQARLSARLDRRLIRDDPRPVALALSGGGDSVALLRLAVAWAKGAGRPVLALTVDHGLHPDSAAWTRFAGEAARALGAEWRGLAWAGDKPAIGLTAAARAARHRLIAEAAREAGARVVLLAHTADDVAEAERMRAEGSTLGRVREWSPSPAWPEGRGLMLLRPLLDERRAVLRSWLADQGADWIEDPANSDLRYGRSRARRALAEGAQAEGPETASSPAAPSMKPAEDFQTPRDGLVQLKRDVSARVLAAALVCVGGGSTPPRGDRLARLIDGLRGSDDFTATLCGARLEAAASTAILMREAGEAARGGLRPLALIPRRAAVWDGRYLFETQAVGWRVEPARGRLASLSAADRAVLGRLPPAARGAAPVLIRDGETAPVLASPAVRRRDLVPERLSLALDETTHEHDLVAPPWRKAVEAPIFFGSQSRPSRPAGSADTEDLNEPA